MQEMYRTNCVHHSIVPVVDSHTAIAPAPGPTSVACMASVAYQIVVHTATKARTQASAGPASAQALVVPMFPTLARGMVPTHSAAVVAGEPKVSVDQQSEQPVASSTSRARSVNPPTVLGMLLAYYEKLRPSASSPLNSSEWCEPAVDPLSFGKALVVTLPIRYHAWTDSR